MDDSKVINPQDPSPANAQQITRKIRQILTRSDVGVVIATTILFLIFTFTTDSFLTRYNQFNISRTAALYVFVGLGQMIVLVVGDMNLSLGAIGALSVVAAGVVMDDHGYPPIVGIIIPLLVGTAAGLFNGVVIVKTRINSFIITLASLFTFSGLVTGISKGFPYTGIPRSFTTVGRRSWEGVPYLFWLALLVLIIIGLFFRYTVRGRRILATGGNREAAQLSGVRTDNIVMFCHAMSGFFAAMAGLLWVSRMGSAQPGTGSDWLIISFAVAIIGGTALTGGETSMLGLLASAILITLIKNGLIMWDVNIYYEQTFLGLIILSAVTLERMRDVVTTFVGRLRRKEAMPAD